MGWNGLTQFNTREAFVQMRGEALVRDVKWGNKMPSWEIRVPLCGIRAHRALVNTLALSACSSIFLFSCTQWCCLSECRVSCINLLFSTIWQAQRRLFDSSHAIQANCFLLSPVTLEGHHQGLFCGYCLCCRLSAQHWPLAASRRLEKHFNLNYLKLMLKFGEKFFFLNNCSISPHQKTANF